MRPACLVCTGGGRFEIRGRAVGSVLHRTTEAGRPHPASGAAALVGTCGPHVRFAREVGFLKFVGRLRDSRFPGRPRPVVPTPPVARERRWGHAARVSGLQERWGFEIRGRAAGSALSRTTEAGRPHLRSVFFWA